MTITATRPHPTPAPEPARTSRRLPVGARFPRRTAAAELALPSAADSATRSPAPVFPVGARFPRRSHADIVAYLSEYEGPAPTTPARNVRPVGARFPRMTG